MKMILLLALLLTMLTMPLLMTTMAASPEPTDQNTHVVIGTLEELDTSKMSGKIKTDLGQTVVFMMTRPDLFKGLSVGQRIAVRLDDQGHVTRVMDTTVPELPSPDR
ncbi:MAG: hypothetical protein ABIP05_03930 [Nitrospiraceae bacterium]